MNGLVLPHGACDAHCHVFGPAARFPYDPARSYTPGDAPGSALMALHRRLGFQHAILVQAACHGCDLSAMLDTIAASKGRYRGVALVPPDIAADALADMHAAGVRGVRFNFLPHLGPPPGRAQLERLCGMIAPLGWHLALHVRAPDLADMEPMLRSLPLPFVVDHLARVDGTLATWDAVYDLLLRVLDLPNAWLKISGADRASAEGSPYRDTLPLLRRLVDARADRLVWGTDWPHPNVRGPVPRDEDLLALLAEAAHTPGRLTQILCDNPRILYHLDEAEAG